MNVHRIEVQPTEGAGDPRGQAALQSARHAALDTLPDSIHSSNVYLLEGDIDTASLERIAHELLCHPVTEAVVIGARPLRAKSMIEVHPLPGVTDPDAEAVELAIRSLVGCDVRVRTGRRYDVGGLDAESARQFASRCLANPLIHGVYTEPYHPDAFPEGHVQEFEVRTLPLRTMDDDSLESLSRDAHLFLSLEEMQAIRDAYEDMGRDPREIELETLAQTWSEHCVHKTLKARMTYRGELPNAANRPGHSVDSDGLVHIDNLLKSTVAAATHELMADGLGDWCLSVFVDNAGIVGFDEEHAVCFKVETHNHPSALEPYGGAATGIGGCIRDVMGTGLAARPIAATDIFCTARLDGFVPDTDRPLPAGCLHPRRILSQVVAGVRDYGNRMGIPTVNGTVWFDDDYVGNPLVYCGCVGVMPRNRVHGDPVPGDRIIALGGRTGRDGIHGATFSSAELTDTHVDEFSHAVQIGNPITEKKTLDAIIEARDDEEACLYSAITDCGAGGFSSAVGEMGETLGADVQLDRAPLKYAGLTPVEIWISEAQERMVLAVPSKNVARLQEICDKHDVELCDLGEFGTEGRELILRHGETEVGRMPMELLHEGLPDRVREASWSPPGPAPVSPVEAPSISEALPSLLAHPNIASKRCIIEQYDHEVQGRSVVRPQVGVHGTGPSDAAVILPVPGSHKGLGIANGLAMGFHIDPYFMAIAAFDECIRNLVCVGVDPSQIAVLDNFCWPGCDDEQRLGELVRAAEGCYDAAKAYRAPFISGKDSLNNQFTTEDGTTIRIPPTLLISGLGIVDDVRRCITMDAKHPDSELVIVGETSPEITGSVYAERFQPHRTGDPGRLPAMNVTEMATAAARVASAIAAGLVRSAHDCSEGGILVAAAEMAFAGNVGLEIDPSSVPGTSDIEAALFSETPGRYLLEVAPGQGESLAGLLGDTPHACLGHFNDSSELKLVDEASFSLENLRMAWLGTIDW
ncbi:MAG: phosphoribosylformylglycinamidine synthase subunit PurL [Planctomycetota bacterium]|nr:phosphoribosylformylglycinamidine synthase subunit PurL [Planctomycetota bacterium]